MKYFQNVTSLEELKKQFKQLAKKYHPDLGGSNEIMREIIAEYEELKAKFENGTATDHEERDFRQVIMNIIHLDGIEIEICGSWIWVSGNTYPHKEILKENGFRFSKVKKMWYWSPIEIKKKRRQSVPMEQIRAKYGSMVVITDDAETPVTTR